MFYNKYNIQQSWYINKKKAKELSLVEFIINNLVEILRFLRCFTDSRILGGCLNVLRKQQPSVLKLISTRINKNGIYFVYKNHLLVPK